MIVYKAQCLDGYEGCIPFPDELLTETIGLHDGEPRTTWGPVTARLHQESRGRALKYADSPWLDGSTPLVRGDAHELLAPLLDGCGQQLPFEVPGERISVVHAWRREGVIDEAKAEFKYWPSGKLRGFEKPAFHAERLEGCAVFRAPFKRSGVLVTDLFVDAWFGAELTGLGFSELWRS